MAASIRLSRTAKDKFVHNVVQDLPNIIKQLEYQLEDVYWGILIEKTTHDPGLQTRYNQLFDRVKGVRTETSGFRRRGDTYGYYIFTCRDPSQEFSMYSLAQSYSRVYVEISPDECNSISTINEALNRERNRVSSFRQFMYNKMETCNNTKQVAEIFPQFASYLPT